VRPHESRRNRIERPAATGRRALQVYPGGGNDHNFRLVGSLAFLTDAGECYYNARTQELYLWAANGEEPADIYAISAAR
jgi:hypothetical protein